MFNRDSKVPKGSEMETLKRFSSDSYLGPRKKTKSFDSDLFSTSSQSNISNCSEETKKHFIFRKSSSAPTTTQSAMPNEIMNCNINLENSDSCRSSDMRTDLDVLLHEKTKHTRFEIPEQVNRVCRRRFPGPAGLLPEQKNGSRSEFKDTYSQSGVEEICSQGTCLKFSSGPWKEMLDDYPVTSDRINLPEKYNIQWIKDKVIAKTLINQRTPFLAAFIHSINCNTSPNSMVDVVLKDRSGTIQGTILPKLHELYSNDLTVGSVLVLKQIGVLNAGLKTEPYLIITPNNLISIYTNNPENSQKPSNKVSKIIVKDISIDDIYKNIEKTSCDNKLKKTIAKPLGCNNDTHRYDTNKNNVQKSKTLSSNEFCDKDDEIEEFMVQFLDETESSNNVQQKNSDISKENVNDASCSNAVGNTSKWKIVSTDSPQLDKAKDNHRILQDMFEGLDTNLLFEEF